MTVAPESSQLNVSGMPGAVAALRAHGLRVSGARRVVLEALFAADGPATADELAGGFDGLTTASDLASMYRNLETLTKVGLVRHVRLGAGAGRYLLAARCARGYVTCGRCGSFEALGDAPLDALRRALAGSEFHDGVAPLTLVGVCTGCRQTDARA